MTPLLTIRDLSVSFPRPGGGRARAVDGLSLAVHAGQTVAIVGESGSGKSLTALTLLGLQPSSAIVDSGSAVLARHGAGDVDLVGLSPQALRSIRGGHIAMIFQEPMTSLNPVMTVGRQIVEAVVVHQKQSKPAARVTAVAAMNEVGIADAASRFDAYPHEFSGGMRQRVMIAMALSCRPSLLLADEPTTALDVTVQAQVLDLLRSLQRSRGMAMLFITHALGIVPRIADAVAVMYAGRLLEFGPVGAVLGRPLHPYTQGLLACSPSLERPAERLSTVGAFVENAESFTPVGGHRPWWPGRGAERPMLMQAAPGRWLAVEGAGEPAVGDAIPSLTPAPAPGLRA